MTFLAVDTPTTGNALVDGLVVLAIGGGGIGAFVKVLRAYLDRTIDMLTERHQAQEVRLATMDAQRGETLKAFESQREAYVRASEIQAKAHQETVERIVSAHAVSMTAITESVKESTRENSAAHDKIMERLETVGEQQEQTSKVLIRLDRDHEDMLEYLKDGSNGTWCWAQPGGVRGVRGSAAPSPHPGETREEAVARARETGRERSGGL